MPHETIKLDVDGAVATITLNRPEKLNALSPQLRGELENALAALLPEDFPEGPDIGSDINRSRGI